jgi:hypothetical protein
VNHSLCIYLFQFSYVYIVELRKLRCEEGKVEEKGNDAKKQYDCYLLSTVSCTYDTCVWGCILVSREVQIMLSV